jgi:hypothetical protein
MFKDNARKNPRCNSPSQSQMGKWTLFQASSHRRHFSLVGGVAKLAGGVARYIHIQPLLPAKGAQFKFLSDFYAQGRYNSVGFPTIVSTKFHPVNGRSLLLNIHVQLVN